MTEASASSSLLVAAGPSLASRRLRALMAEPKVTIGGGFIVALIVIALFAPWIAPKNPLDQDLMLASLPPAELAERRAGLLPRHGRSWPRRSLTPHLWRTHRADRGFRRREPRSARRHGARIARGLVSRPSRRLDLPARRHLDGLPAGVALDPTRRRSRRRRWIGHSGDRHYRLDALLPGRTRRDDGAG